VRRRQLLGERHDAKSVDVKSSLPDEPDALATSDTIRSPKPSRYSPSGFATALGKEILIAMRDRRSRPMVWPCVATTSAWLGEDLIRLIGWSSFARPVRFTSEWISWGASARSAPIGVRPIAMVVGIQCVADVRRIALGWLCSSTRAGRNICTRPGTGLVTPPTLESSRCENYPRRIRSLRRQWRDCGHHSSRIGWERGHRWVRERLRGSRTARAAKRDVQDCQGVMEIAPLGVLSASQKQVGKNGSLNFSNVSLLAVPSSADLLSVIGSTRSG